MIVGNQKIPICLKKISQSSDFHEIAGKGFKFHPKQVCQTSGPLATYLWPVKVLAFNCCCSAENTFHEHICTNCGRWQISESIYKSVLSGGWMFLLIPLFLNTIYTSLFNEKYYSSEKIVAFKILSKSTHMAILVYIKRSKSILNFTSKTLWIQR